jgi:hypothetical protein
MAAGQASSEFRIDRFLIAIISLSVLHRRALQKGSILIIQIV